MQNHASTAVGAQHRCAPACPGWPARLRSCCSEVVSAAFRSGRFFLAVAILFTFLSPAQTSASLSGKLRTTRTSPLDLELSGDLANLPPNSTRYIAREDLLAFPQVSYTVTNDANFNGPTKITGVSLQELARQLSAAPNSDLLVALCDDQYRANYPQAYISAHDPVLVLKINGQPPSGWPKDAEGHNLDMGPYLISHPDFQPSFKILGHAEDPQNPWGVVHLEFRDETAVFGAIAPRGPRAQDQQVQAGYRLAQQNCFRCHNMGAEGGQKAGHPWLVLSAWATAQPNYLAAYIHNPKGKNPNAQMPSFPEYDDTTLRALIAYFQAFTAVTRETP
jgi:mono/diheme cytochrome c family protein